MKSGFARSAAQTLKSRHTTLMTPTIAQDKNTGRSRGFGFLWFPSEGDRSAAIEDMHKSMLRDREISVTAAVPQSQTAPGTPASALGGYRRTGPSRGGYGGGYGADRGRYGDRGGYGGGYGADRGCVVQH
jgi:RNA recognition motif-containing protein